MPRTLILFFLEFNFLINSIHAQSDTLSKKINLIINPKVERLLEKKLMINQRKKGISGYRVQIHFGSSREIAKDIKSKYLTIYKESNAYELYQQPNFKIRVGDFRTRLEAQKMLKEILVDFPNSFIVQDEINIANQ